MFEVSPESRLSWPTLFVGMPGTESRLHVDQMATNFWMAVLRSVCGTGARARSCGQHAVANPEPGGLRQLSSTSTRLTEDCTDSICPIDNFSAGPSSLSFFTLKTPSTCMPQDAITRLRPQILGSHRTATFLQQMRLRRTRSRAQSSRCTNTHNHSQALSNEVSSPAGKHVTALANTMPILTAERRGPGLTNLHCAITRGPDLHPRHLAAPSTECGRRDQHWGFSKLCEPESFSFVQS